MNTTLRSVVGVVLLVAVASCSGSKEKCQGGSDCQDGYGCVSGACRPLCFTQLDCGGNEICWEGVCGARSAGSAPEIVAVSGNTPESPQQITDGLVITGRSLGAAIFELRNSANAAVPLTARNQTDQNAEVVLPANVRQGLHKLVATNQAGSTTASVTLELPELSGDLLVDRINTQATAKLALGVMPDALVALQAQYDALAARQLALEDKSCPQGYTRDTTRTDIVLCYRGADQMVKVGDFWVDRYEGLIASPTVYANGLCDGTCVDGTTCFGMAGVSNYPSTFPNNGNVTDKANALYACSVQGVLPSRMMTWFQAAQACAASGKHLMTNDEWQTAAAGTPDPGSWPTPTGTCAGDVTTYHPRQCNTCSSGLAPSGDTSCVSLYGAEDMVGNLWEWTAQWWQAGLYNNGTFTDWGQGKRTTAAWPGSYGGDATWNVAGRAVTGDGLGWADGAPAAVGRGGDYTQGSFAGVFAISTNDGPSTQYNVVGFRCARR